MCLCSCTLLSPRGLLSCGKPSVSYLGRSLPRAGILAGARPGAQVTSRGSAGVGGWGPPVATHRSQQNNGAGGQARPVAHCSSGLWHHSRSRPRSHAERVAPCVHAKVMSKSTTHKTHHTNPAPRLPPEKQSPQHACNSARLHPRQLRSRRPSCPMHIRTTTILGQSPSLSSGAAVVPSPRPRHQRRLITALRSRGACWVPAPGSALHHRRAAAPCGEHTGCLERDPAERRGPTESSRRERSCARLDREAQANLWRCARAFTGSDRLAPVGAARCTFAGRKGSMTWLARWSRTIVSLRRSAPATRLPGRPTLVVVWFRLGVFWFVGVT